MERGDLNEDLVILIKEPRGIGVGVYQDFGCRLNMQMIEAMNDTKQLQMKSRGVGYMKSIVRGGAL